MEKLADDIRRLRNNLGLTQAPLAEILGVTVVTVSRWENGHVRPNRFLLKSLSSFLQDTSSSKRPDSTRHISKNLETGWRGTPMPGSTGIESGNKGAADLDASSFLNLWTKFLQKPKI